MDRAPRSYFDGAQHERPLRHRLYEEPIEGEGTGPMPPGIRVMQRSIGGEGIEALPDSMGLADYGMEMRHLCSRKHPVYVLQSGV